MVAQGSAQKLTRQSASVQELARATTRDPRWEQVLSRSAAAEGRFFYAVKTTGVYCRPACAARTPRPENVVFFGSLASAERAGYRACKRCRPDEPVLGDRQAASVADLCRFIQQAERAPSLSELGERARLSVYHVQRVFKAVTGLTPKAYAAAQRASRVRSELGTAASVTQAIYAAGYGASSRFYAEAKQVLGMSATSYRAGGELERIRFAVGRCSLGRVLVAASVSGVCAVFLGDDPKLLSQQLKDRFPRAELEAGGQAFERLLAQVVGFVEAPGAGLRLPLDLRGTAFQQRVWQALQQIPLGETVSYAEVARGIGAPKSARAVATACAANPVAVAVPCHRVVRGDGALSGYRWGTQRKRALLEREAKAALSFEPRSRR